MLFATSNAPVTRKTAPIATDPNPSTESRSGASTDTAPKSSAGSTTNQNAPSTRGSLKARPSMRSGLWCLGTRRRGRRSPRDEPEGGDSHGAEGPARSRDRRDTAEHRPEQRAADRRCERGADETAAPSRRGGGDEPGERAGPGEGACEPLEETREIELPGLGCDPEEHGAEGDRREPNHYCGLNSGARGDDTARDGADECPGRVRGRQHPAPALPRPSVSAYRGSNGVSAAKKSVSKKTIALVRSRSLRTRLLCRSGMRVWLVVLAVLAFPGLAHGGTVFLLDGRGWGHGVGMSQWGAEGYARHGFGYRQILAHYYPHTHVAPTTPREVRVLLQENQPMLRVGSSAPFLVVDARGEKVHLSPRTVVVRRGFKQLVFPLRFEPGVQPLRLGGAGYRGAVVVKAKPGGLMAVNVLPLDRYLRGVVPWEVPVGWHTQTYEAQAVAARSYTLAMLKPGEDFDLYPDDRSQMYGGIKAERTETNLAIGATAGQVLEFGDTIIPAYYFSSSGGRTSSIHDEWPQMQQVPYLVSVADPYDYLSPHHVWPTAVLTPARVAAELHVSGVLDLRVVRNSSGRAEAVRALTASGWKQFPGTGDPHEVQARIDRLRHPRDDPRRSAGPARLRQPRSRAGLGSRPRQGAAAGVDRGRLADGAPYPTGAFRALRSVDSRRALHGAPSCL